jgi:adenine-specific DNA-methyltransferase
LENIQFLAPKYMEVRKKWTVVELDFLTEDKKVKPTSAWTFKEVNSERGSEQFVELGFDKEIFPKPKPLGLLLRILKMTINPFEENIVMDFFAGSGSFAHAVVQFNDENKCDIKHMSIQLPYLIAEGEYAYKKGYRKISEITKERIRRAINRSKTKDNGFRVFRLGRSCFKPWSNYSGNNVMELELQYEKAVTPLLDEWKKEDLLYEILIMEGFPLESKIEILAGYTKNHLALISSDFCEHKLLICLDNIIQYDTIKSIKINEEDIFICLDNAISDRDKVTLQDKGLIKTI